jgi:hypothetical protein
MDGVTIVVGVHSVRMVRKLVGNTNYCDSSSSASSVPLLVCCYWYC